MQDSLNGQEFPRNVPSLKELHQVQTQIVSKIEKISYLQVFSSKLKKRLKFHLSVEFGTRLRISAKKFGINREDSAPS